MMKPKRPGKNFSKGKGRGGKSKGQQNVKPERPTKEHPFKAFQKQKQPKLDTKKLRYDKEREVERQPANQRATTPEEHQERFEEMRLNRYVAHAGVASRRKADELIKEGKVTVNGKVVTEMGYKVKVKDKVSYEGKQLNIERKVYILMNKPKNVITTTSDERGRKTVVSLTENAAPGLRLYPVGRLDRNTTGLIMLTNDGEVAQKLSHPSYEVKKIYMATLDKEMDEEDFVKIKDGITLEDGAIKVDQIAYTDPDDLKIIGVELHSGKNRIVRRIFEHVGYEVIKLDRVYYAGFTKKNLPRGRWRHLTEKEVIMLKHFN